MATDHRRPARRLSPAPTRSVDHHLRRDEHCDSHRGPESTGKTRPHRARRGEGDRLRDEILDATEALILESGNADAVSIRQVAQAVDRTPPSIYLHFSTKDELMQAVCQRRFDADDRALPQRDSGR